MNIKDKITIVIPSYNEEKYIEKTITSITKQNNIIGTRVIVSDNNSTDNTKSIVLHLKEKYKSIINIEIINGGTVSQGRNNGAIITTTKYILFLDSDVQLLNKNTIDHTLFDMYHKHLDLLTCKVKCKGFDIRAHLIFMAFNPINELISLKKPFAVGTYFLTKKDKFFEHGMFDESLHHSEDYVLSQKYDPKKFHISKYHITQDNRRFKKTGYFGMIKLVVNGFFNKNNIDYYKKDIGYWK